MKDVHRLFQKDARVLKQFNASGSASALQSVDDLRHGLSLLAVLRGDEPRDADDHLGVL